LRILGRSATQCAFPETATDMLYALT
jgi:hypothetical protein